MRPEISVADDESLARQAQGGSMDAFEQLVYRYEARIYRFVIACGCPQSDASDVVQDSFVRAFQGLSKYHPNRSFASWLFTIARHKCIDRHRAAPEPTVELAPDLPDPQDAAEALARVDDGRQIWNLARKKLPQVQFQALWLRYAEDLPVAEIATVLKLTSTHVKVTLFRARRTLLATLQPKSASVAPNNNASRITPTPTPAPARDGTLPGGSTSIA